MIRGTFVLIGAAALGACATDRVTLLDNEMGHPDGAVAVLSADGGETVIDTPNTQALLRSGTPRTRSIDPNNPAYTELLEKLPPPATRFQVIFPNDEFQIPPDQRGVIDQIRTELARRPGAQIEVAGFTDSTGEDDYNVNLSKQRAEAVAAELRQSGFEIDAADAVGRGEYEAKAELGDNVADASYRRVYVIIR